MGKPGALDTVFKVDTKGTDFKTDCFLLFAGDIGVLCVDGFIKSLSGTQCGIKGCGLRVIISVVWVDGVCTGRIITGEVIVVNMHSGIIDLVFKLLSTTSEVLRERGGSELSKLHGSAAAITRI